MKGFVIALALVATPVAAQSPSMAAQAAAPAANPHLVTVQTLWDGITSYITRAAEQIPEGRYSYRPTPQVRSFGEMIGHIAGAQNMFCAIALGEPPRGEDDIEKTVTTKQGLVAALKASTEYCKRAYAQSDAAAAGVVKLFGQDRSRFHALTMNATHNAEHYGNIVTYMRMNSMVPPSSQPRR